MYASKPEFEGHPDVLTSAVRSHSSVMSSDYRDEIVLGCTHGNLVIFTSDAADDSLIPHLSIHLSHYTTKFSLADSFSHVSLIAEQFSRTCHFLLRRSTGIARRFSCTPEHSKNMALYSPNVANYGSVCNDPRSWPAKIMSRSLSTSLRNSDMRNRRLYTTFQVLAGWSRTTTKTL